MTTRKLSERQVAVLKALYDHGRYPDAWFWQNRSTTVSILNGLVKRGLVKINELDHYILTPAGREQVTNR
jgi:DNA-binding MarR family transcriptional regulator